MKTTSTANIRLKDGRLFKPGTSFKIIPSPDRPDYGVLCFPSKGGSSFRLPYHRLPLYFKNDIHLITQQEIESALMHSFCPSITGEDVEPDGHDSHGFPSWLLALGMI